ncbi:MAG: bifunctional diaminohydroxyphosphoribosylaminopyrimidine deaminase/5-amino-6-(5-phosphoribosylamino)uracil reductase RibD, partial [Flavobacteriales bacterium]
MNVHDIYMLRCIELAAAGRGWVHPNPLVGSVIVNQGSIIGEGYHARYGGPHAEVAAIQTVRDKSALKDATLYVNLEPCSHYGKTPPCADLIIQSGLKRVVVGMCDPYHEVSGRGIQRLRDAGIEVVVDVLRAECEALNERFIRFHAMQRPTIILKWAQTSDGFMDVDRTKGRLGSVAISGEETRRLVHLWRAQEHAILIGARTAIHDRPSLTVRAVQGRNPIRLVLDAALQVLPEGPLFDDAAPTYVLCDNVDSQQLHSFAKRIEHISTDIRLLLPWAYEQGIQSIFVEGGASILQQLIHANCWDEARIITAPVMWGSGLKAPEIQGEVQDEFSSGVDLVRVLR